MQRELKQELISFYIVFLKSIGMPKWVIHKAMGLTALQANILTERAKVTRKVWLDIMWRDGWRCYLLMPYDLRGCVYSNVFCSGGQMGVLGENRWL